MAVVEAVPETAVWELARDLQTLVLGGDCVDGEGWGNLGCELAMSKEPVAFMSYVRADDAHEAGRLTQFCERLASEVRMQTGEAFPIFQDRNIAWGQQWKERIDGSIDTVTFLIPVITPGFFKSPPCREELERFLDREKKLGRSDLIFPVYYVTTDVLDEESKRSADPLASAIASRQFADWRELRFEPLTAPAVCKTLVTMARQIMQAMKRGQTSPQSSPGGGEETQPVTARVRERAGNAGRQRDLRQCYDGG